MTKKTRVFGVAIAAIAVGATIGCSNPGGSGTGGPTGGTGQIGTSAPGLTSGPTDAPTTPAPSYPSSASAYATAAVTAWKNGDTNRLSDLSDPGNGIWSTLNGGNYNKVFHVYVCEGAAGSSICTMYNTVGDELDLRLENDLIGQAHAVIDGQWHPITFPNDFQAYAQEAVDDWTKHNTAAVALLTGKPGDTAFSAVPAARRNDTWTFDHEEGASGHAELIFVNSAGDSIIVQFAQPGVAPTPANRHGLIETIYYEAH